MKTLLLFLFLLLNYSANVFSQIIGELPINNNNNITLPGGNYVVKDTLYDEGSLTDIGIVSLYDGTTNALISTLKGAENGDKVGNYGIIILQNGNLIVLSTNKKYNNPNLRFSITLIKNNYIQNITISPYNSLIYYYPFWSYYSENNKIIGLSNGNFIHFTKMIGDEGTYHIVTFYKNDNLLITLNNTAGISLFSYDSFPRPLGDIYGLYEIENSNILLNTSFLGENCVKTFNGNTGGTLLSFCSDNFVYHYPIGTTIGRCLTSEQIIANELLKITYKSCPVYYPPIRLNVIFDENPIIDVFANTNTTLAGAEPFLKVEPIGVNPIGVNMYTAKVWLNEMNAFNVDNKYYLSRHFEITPLETTPSITAKVKLYFTQAEFDNYNSKVTNQLKLPTGPDDTFGKSNLQIIKYAGVSNNNYGMPDSYPGTKEIIKPLVENVIWQGKMWEVSFDVIGFSGFYLSTALLTPLPIKFLNFTAEYKNRSVILNWQTSGEINSESYTIEKSDDAKKFSEIGMVKAYNKIENNFYSFQDQTIYNNTLSENLFYRLKIKKLDGEISFSKIVIAKKPFEKDIEISPNPIENSLSIKFQNPNLWLQTEVQIINQLGQKIKEFKIDKQYYNVDLNGLASGMYYLSFSDGSILKFIKK